jgi:predicted permease
MTARENHRVPWPRLSRRMSIVRVGKNRSSIKQNPQATFVQWTIARYYRNYLDMMRHLGNVERSLAGGLVLGMQLRRATFPVRPAAVLIAVVFSLLVAPLIGFSLSAALGMTGVARDVAIVVSAMPAAVVTTVLTLEFDLDSTSFISVVFVSTLLTPLTLVLLIAYLKG